MLRVVDRSRGGPSRDHPYPRASGAALVVGRVAAPAVGTCGRLLLGSAALPGVMVPPTGHTFYLGCASGLSVTEELASITLTDARSGS